MRGGCVTGFEKACQLRSHVAQGLNVPTAYASGLSLAPALLDSLLNSLRMEA